MKSKILIADDEKGIREGLSESLETDGYDVVVTADGESAWKRYQKGDIDLAIIDLRMPGVNGDELLKRIKADSSGLPVIILTGHGTVKDAVEAMRNGAWDFLTKPVDIDRLSILVKRALSNRERRLERQLLEEELERHRLNNTVIGSSETLRRVFDTVERVAPTKASVLITGESGVGKELIADAIHRLSPRKDKPFIKVHCAALAESILESELFGHEKGAFTGAASLRRGKFELANEGTLFLDEIGEIDQNIQIKLLRVLQERKFERVGGEETIETNIRLVTATNKDLKAEIEKRTFREDLYYRLNVVTIFVPPLRERKDDIPMLISSFTKKFSEENNKPIEGVDEEARSCLFNYDWPGNVRELRNCIESAVVMCKGHFITEEDLPPTIRNAIESDWIRIPSGATMEKAEEIIIRETLAAQKGNKSITAKILNIGRKTIHRKLSNYEKTGDDAHKTVIEDPQDGD
ncbi:MAG: sigma-54 dependent transcriptional regulator [Spirochaetaceae bacterium]|jgi:DNA-binding NtrC family response regulator|nr:sigma-54 dependent transcriptional regulator [Spirochaetaceae bacterium]